MFKKLIHFIRKHLLFFSVFFVAAALIDILPQLCSDGWAWTGISIALGISLFLLQQVEQFSKPQPPKPYPPILYKNRFIITIVDCSTTPTLHHKTGYLVFLNKEAISSESLEAAINATKRKADEMLGQN